nr:retrotransposon Orf1 [Tanacetum cinerariifolium]
MENPEQAFVEYTSLRTDEAGGLVSNFMASQDARLSKFEADFKQQQSKMTNKIDTVLKAITDRIAGALPSDTVKNPKLITSMVLSCRPYPIINLQCSTHIHGSINAITIHPKQSEESQVNKPDEGPNKGERETNKGPEVEYFNTFLTRDELTYHKYLMTGLIPLIFLKNPIIMKRCPFNLKIPCNIRENLNRGVSNFTGRIKGMHVFVGNFTYVVDFMIVEEISSIIDPRLSQVVLGRPFVEISNMTHDPPEGVVRNHEDMERGVEYVMNKILGFYKECVELGPEYVTGLDDEGEVT